MRKTFAKNKNLLSKMEEPKPKKPYEIPEKKVSELTVFTKAKDLSKYVFTVTLKSPKHFRFSIVGRLHNLCLDLIENLYRANGTMVICDKRAEALQKRLTHQSEAMVALDLLDYMAQLACEQQCLLLKQWEQIGKQVLDCKRLLGAWINSDNKRFA
ncbi:MAG: four helix bundle protein [Firmicutes bacterium]|nr:four helix bundle protein [Bacillota bacterium]